MSAGGPCELCGRASRLTSAVVVVLVWAPSLARPYPLLPAEDYCLCDNDGCYSALRFVQRAMEAHPTTRDLASSWTDAQIDWCDAAVRPWRIKHRRPEMATA